MGIKMGFIVYSFRKFLFTNGTAISKFHILLWILLALILECLEYDLVRLLQQGQ